MAQQTDVLAEVGVGLAGRRVLVVGAAGGIGEATAILLSKLGARLLLADRADLSRTAAALGDAVEAVHSVDLADGAATAALVEEAAAQAPLYGLVNTAAILQRTPLEEVGDSVLSQEIAINQTGAFHLARAALRVMAPAGEGRIVMLTSQGAFTGGFHGSVNYAMTKAAVGALVKSLAREGAAHGVTVNAIAPGGIETPMLRSGMSEDALASFRDRIPMGRYGAPSEIAGACAFLLCGWGGYVTGATIHVNGGQLML